MEVGRIAIASLVPPEKNDTLVYIVLALPVAFWIVEYFTRIIGYVPESPTDWLALIGLAGSGLGLILYLVPFDVLVVRTIQRWLVNKHQEKGRNQLIRDTILSGNIFIQSWMTHYEAVRDNWLDEYQRSYIQSSVASYPVRKRSWLWRLSFYNLLAFIAFMTPPLASILPTLAPQTLVVVLIVVLFGGLWSAVYWANGRIVKSRIITATIVIVVLEYAAITMFQFITSTPDSGILSMTLLLYLIVAVSLCAGGLPLVALWWRDYRKSKSHTIGIGHVTELFYLRDFVEIDALKNPEEYVEDTQRHILRGQLDSLHSTLLRNDWGLFVYRWGQTRGMIINEVKDCIEEFYIPSMLHLYLDLLEETTSEVTTKKRLSWFWHLENLKKITRPGLAKIAVDRFKELEKEKSELAKKQKQISKDDECKRIRSIFESLTESDEWSEIDKYKARSIIKNRSGTYIRERLVKLKILEA